MWDDNHQITTWFSHDLIWNNEQASFKQNSSATSTNIPDTI